AASSGEVWSDIGLRDARATRWRIMRLASSRFWSEEEYLRSAVAALVKARVPSLDRDHPPAAAPAQRRTRARPMLPVGPDRWRDGPSLRSWRLPARFPSGR